MKSRVSFLLIFFFLFVSSFENAEFLSKARFATVQPPTGGNYTLYKLEEYIYCLLTGFLLLLTMGIIISLNEQNALISENSLQMASKDTVIIANGQIDFKNQNKLVLINEEIVTKWPIFEDELFFNVSTGYKLFRKVEVLQYYELNDPDKSKDYIYYPLIWKAEEINSEEFKNKSFKNPKYEEWKMFDREFVTKDASIGAFSLDSSTISLLENYKEFNLEEIKLDFSKIAKKYENKFHVSKKENFLTFTQSKTEESCGDFRVKYFICHQELVSLIGKQNGNTIEEFDYYYENAKMYYAHNETKKEYLEDLEGKIYTTENGQKYVMTPSTMKRVKRKSAYKDLYSFFYKGSGIKLTIRPIQSIFKIIIGKYNKDSILDEIRKENPIHSWKVRILGFFVNFLAFCIIVTPFGDLFQILPFYNSIKNFAVTVFAASASLLVTILLVVISWWKFRPYTAAGIVTIVFIIPAISIGVFMGIPK